ncbi:DUF4134 domain-containing protein [Fibrivirga algicola]|uniref:DUF4134 domain-containing protein n=1 Tax=Fibrivirga algicola TaxID=2950420 RepID=A0ABX0QSZ1_9BACT|nr:DUF4134 domain-containing protein [Fibrivirga algicola]NID13668.1 DUF4134 domain-containing protein [Fibrivirga algicola]
MKRFTIVGRGLLLIAVTTTTMLAQTVDQTKGIGAGVQVLTQTTRDLQEYFRPMTTVMYVIAAIVGIFGAFRIYSKMQAGDQDVQKSAVNWGGSVLFLLAFAAILQAVFFQNA